jgi:amino acid transporter
MGAMSQGALSESSAPLADILNKVTGTNLGGKLFAAVIVLTSFGTGSGWILSTGRAGYSMAKEGFFPKAFEKVNPKTGTPIFALVFTSVLINIMFLLNFIGLTEAFDFLIIMATISMLPAYGLTALAEIVLLKKFHKKITPLKFIGNSLVQLIAFAYVLYAIFGSGAEAAMYTLILIFLGVPVYIYSRIQRGHKFGVHDEE